MEEQLREFSLELGGRTVEGVWDRVARYCGLPWSGGPPETWAYRYYDVLDTDPSTITPLDVLAAAALHPGLARSDLAYFTDRRGDLEAWLASFPANARLREADDSVLDRLVELGAGPGPSLSLLTKVLHRKRPELIPLVDRHLLDWYRPVTGERSARAAWPDLLRALRDDLGGLNALLLAMMGVELEKQTGRQTSHLRLLDISIWMGGRR